MLKKNFLNILYVFFLGAISSYSLPPYNYFIINFFTFSLFFIFLFTQKKTNPNNKSFFKYGWFFGFGYFLCSLYWIAISLTFDESFKFLIPIAIVLFPAFLAIFYGFITYLFSVFYSRDVVSTFFIFSILFGSIEFIRGSILTGFPWNLIAFSFSESIYFIQILSVIGTYSFNLICISLFTVPAVFILRKTRKEIIVCFFFIIISVGFLVFGNLKYNQFNAGLNNITGFIYHTFADIDNDGIKEIFSASGLGYYMNGDTYYFKLINGKYTPVFYHSGWYGETNTTDKNTNYWPFVDEKNNLIFFTPSHNALYKTSINIYKDHPIFGSGLKTFRSECKKDKYKSSELGCSTHPHNIYLNILSETGIIVFLFFLIHH